MENGTEVTIRDEFIRLGQAMKLAGAVDSGVDAKLMIVDGLVSVNGETELRRGRKLYDGDSFQIDGRNYRIRSLS